MNPASCTSTDLGYREIMSLDSILDYARRIRETRRAGPTNLEQALAPEFKRLLENLLPLIAANNLVMVPE